MTKESPVARELNINRRNRYTLWGITLLVILALALLAVSWSLSSGEMDITFGQIPHIIWKGEGSTEYTVLKNIRLPRIYLGLSIGGALSVAGVILQGIYRNPLVEPYTLGISGGAVLGVAFTIVLGLHQSIGSFMLPFSGFVGALLTIFLVYFLSVKQGKVKMQNMVLMGVMISFIASSAIMFLLSTTTSENLHSIVFWVMGSLDEANGTLITLVVVISLLSLLFSYFFIQPLNALRLGESKARHLGINTDSSIKVLFVIASLLTGVCVSVAGIIGFVGLIIPQFIRLLLGSDYRILLIGSFLTGGTFVVICDTIARTVIAPNELPIGAITGMLGGVAFIAILSRNNKKHSVDRL
jgi:iron complex transport system permease protein